MALSTQTRIARSIGRSRRDIFLRADFAEFGSPSRVTRAINELIAKGKLARLGYGVYAKTVPSVVTGNPIPRKVFESLVVEATAPGSKAQPPQTAPTPARSPDSNKV